MIETAAGVAIEATPAQEERARQVARLHGLELPVALCLVKAGVDPARHANGLGHEAVKALNKHYPYTKAASEGQT